MTTLTLQTAPLAESIRSVVDRRSLSLDAARAAAETIMDGKATPAQIAALLVGLRMKGETVDEIRGFYVGWFR